MQMPRRLRVGIGFATGRKTFQTVLRTYTQSWQEAGLVDDTSVSLNLFVAYDLSSNNTHQTDYTRMRPELDSCIDTTTFVNSGARNEAIGKLIRDHVLDYQEALLLFGEGLAAQRNAILYSCLNRHMDHLVFLDDDEYPMAVTNTGKTASWTGQHVLTTHLSSITRADITHGHQCGYISPIPNIDFNNTLMETDFRLFIEAVSNDIVSWDKLEKVRKNGGVTYADAGVLASNSAVEVQEVENAKFISGSNLCINLRNPLRVFPFYNPPGARGEDTFLSTCLSERTVLRVPCYTFHDGFGIYEHLLHGVLPIRLKFVKADTECIVSRFYNACIGWIRYKPLFTFITQRQGYEETITGMRERLNDTLPLVSEYFGRPAFLNIATELEKYHRNVEEHYGVFAETQRIWARIMEHCAQDQGRSASEV